MASSGNQDIYCEKFISHENNKKNAGMRGVFTGNRIFVWLVRARKASHRFQRGNGIFHRLALAGNNSDDL